MSRKIRVKVLFAGGSFLCLVIGWLCYIHFGREFIMRMYEGRSIAILNNIINAQPLHPVQDYFKEAELLLFVITFYLAFTSILLIAAKEVRLNLVICLLSFIGTILVLICTFPYGAGICPDGITYITVAKSLLSGHGYVCYRGDALIDFPPLFSTALAIFGVAGIDPVPGARIFNAIVFGGIIFASGQLFRTFIRSRALVILGVCSIVLSIPLLFVSMSAWTEPLFILFVILFIFYLYKFLSNKRWPTLILVSTIVAFSCMQKYVGVTLAASGFLSMIFLLPKATFSQKLKYGIVFCVISVTPFFIWIVRNHLLANTFFNLTFPPNFGLLQNIYSALDSFTAWFLPQKIPFTTRIIVVALIILIMLSVRFYLCSKRNRQAHIGLIQISPLGIFIAIYAIFLITGVSLIESDKIEHRFLSPLYVPVIFFILIGIDGILDWLSRSQRTKRAVSAIVVVLFAFWLAYPFIRVLQETSRWMRDGFLVYTTAAWRHSSLIEWLRDHQLVGTIYSNCPNAIYLLTEIRANTSHKRCHGTNPEDSKEEELKKFRASFKLNQRMYLVWFSQKGCNEYKCSLQDLSSVFLLEEVAALPDGTVYFFKSER